MLNQQIWSQFQKTYKTFIIEPNFINVFFCDKVVCLPLIHHIQIRAVEIIGIGKMFFTGECQLLTTTVMWNICIKMS